MSAHAAYKVHITDGGSHPRPYGWEVWRGNSVLIVCSTATFATRGEALADSAIGGEFPGAHAAEPLLGPETSMEPSIAEFLEAVAEMLTAQGTTSRDLLALQFDAKTGDVKVLTRPTSHLEGYPKLGEILEMIVTTCVEYRIEVSHLRSVSFFEDAVALEWLEGTGQGEVHMYPIEEVPPAETRH